MPVKWFDKPDNSSGILSSTLTKDCQIINGVTSTFIFVLLQTLTSVIAGFTIAFVYEWRITLVAIGLIPLIALGGAVRNYFRIGLFKKI
jgi:ABC-type multidrug transport system fused ATPase/permease subunit